MTIDNETGEIITPFIRTPYNYNMDAASEETGLSCPEPTKTQQQFAEEVDINTIIERFGINQELPTNQATPLQGDFTTVTDYQSAQNLILQAQTAFMAMPADVRKEFNNDAGAFLDFVSDPQNKDKAKALGLLVPDPVPAPIPVVKILKDDETPPAK